MLHSACSLAGVSSGRPTPLGATFSQNQTNFALFSAHATQVTLLLFKNGHRYPDKKIRLSPVKNKTGNIWHLAIANLPAYTRYAYQVNGPNTSVSNAFNPRKVLLDPYARALDWQFYDRARACGSEDNLIASLRGIVLPPDNFSWQDDHLPRIPLDQTIIYELHVRGFTKNPNSQTQSPGTFAALQEKLPYLKDLGVTTIELMPILAFDDDIPYQNTQGEELINYWGYSPISYFAFYPKYFQKKDSFYLTELKSLIKAAHQLNLEIILDVVYNHTTEGNQNGPTISWRGIDNATYYLLSPADRHYTMDFTGCGNTLNANHPAVSKMIVDSLEYLAQEFHVDGFRFDLGASFYYLDDQFTSQPPIINLINKNPILSQLKLIAEPWDAAGLNLEGRFGGPSWLEWNGSYRDRLRNFVNFDQEKKDFQAHLAGQAPEFIFFKKDPQLSVNFITAHDGFTLRDLVSYADPQNWENGFHNTDGSKHNLSKNYGVEGETTTQEIIDLRQAQALQMLTYLFATPGVPMLLMGDEMWRTQGGNNNTFCQDNSINWLDWDLLQQNQVWREKVKQLIKQR